MAMQSLDVTLKNLIDETEQVSVSDLYSLSGLERPDLEKVRSTWPTIPAERRATAMRHMVEIAEDNFEVDFGSIYRIGLGDQEASVKVAAIEGLWEEADPALIIPLIKLMQSDEAEIVRASAAGALGRFVYAGEVEDIPAAKASPAVDALKATFAKADETIEVRRRALEALGFLGYNEVGELIQQGYQDANPRMRHSAVFAMGRSLDDRWGETVEKELDSSDPEMRFEAARACGELEYAPALGRLTDLIDDVDEDVQRASVWALGQIGGDGARAILLNVLDSNATHLHAETEEALDELEFKSGTLDFPMFDFDEDDTGEEWVLDEDLDDEDDEE